MYTVVEFKYILKSNPDVRIAGTVSVPLFEDATDENFSITFTKEDGSYTLIPYVQHKGVVLQSTWEQDNEIDQLKELFVYNNCFLDIIRDNIDADGKIIHLEEAYIEITGG